MSPSTLLAQSFPGITQQPQSQSVLAGSNAVFTVVASGQTPLSYQWSFDGTNLTDSSRISGTTGATFTISNLVSSDAGSYQVVVTNRHGSVTSSNATLTVLVPAMVTIQPTNQIVLLGSNALFTAEAIGTEPLYYQWFFNGSPLTDNAYASGTASPALTISGVQTNNAGLYQLVVSNAWGMSGSSNVILQVILPPTISPIANQRTFPNLPTRRIGFTIGDAQTPAGDLIVSATSSSPSLVANSNIVFSGSGPNRTMTATPMGISGTDNITVTVENAYGSVTRETFQLSIAGFTDIGANLTSLDDASVAWGDYDNDGHLDLLLTGQNAAKPYGGGGETTEIYHNNGDGTFTDIGAKLLGIVGGGAVWGDYNNDGKLDVLLGGSTQVYLQSVQYGVPIYGATISGRIYRNDGTNTFTQVADLLDDGLGGGAPTRWTSVGWGDFDNDGKLDALVTSWPSDSLFHNNGNDDFVNSGIGLPGEVYCTTALADFNNDGNLDFILSYGWPTTWQETDLYQNNAGTNFIALTNALPGVCDASIAWEDYNNDGNFDVATVGWGANALFAGDGKGNFNYVTNLPGGDYASVAWGDMDNDGQADLIISTSGGTRILRNNGDGTFTDMGIFLPGGANGGVAVGDFNNDGCLDIAVAAGGITKIFRNDGAMPKAPPDPPQSTEVTFTTNAAIFAWSPATEPNQSAGFSYNLRAGTSPGGIDVVSPMANPATGFRQVPALGNAGLRLSRAIMHLKPGTYYWGVQAVDHAFVGSAFSPEQRFTLVLPFVSSQPSNQTNVLGNTVAFNVGAGGTVPEVYQWCFDGQPLADDGRISGSTTTNLVISKVQASDVGNYTVVVGNLSGSVTSEVATVTILNPLVTVQPQSQSILGGATVNLNVTATGEEPLAYQWQFNGTNILGATSDALVLTNVLVGQSGEYSVIVSNAYGSAVSSNVALDVAALAITMQPTNYIAWPGGSATFSVNVAGSRPFDYQWQLNGSNVSQENTNQLVLTNLLVSQFGSYGVTISNSYGNVTSSNAALIFSQVAVWGGLDGQSNLTSGLTNLVAISSALANPYNCQALHKDGTIVTWPNKLSSYQLSGISNLVAIAGAIPSIGLKSDGDVIGWGYDGAYPIAGMSNSAAISTFGYYDVALKSDGTVVANSSGPPPPPGLSNVVAIAVGSGFGLALKADGTITGWGNSGYGQATAPFGLSNVVAIAAGAYHSLALKADGHVVAWGQNTFGQTDVPGGLSNVVAIAAGMDHSLALKSDGTVAAWGMDIYGQTNVPPGLSKVVSIAAGQYDSMALMGNGPPITHALVNNPTISSNIFSLTLPSQSGKVYVLEYKNLLSASNWTALPLVPGNGTMLKLTDQGATNSQGFYRVLRW